MRAESPEPFVASGAVSADAEEVAELIRTAELAQDGEVETTADDVTEDWARADLASDVVLLREGIRLVAYGWAARSSRGALLDGYVHPEVTGRGLGRYVVRTLEARGRELAPPGSKLETGVSVNDAAGQRLMEEEGFIGIRQFRRMLVDLEAEPVVPELDGVEIRSLRPGEEEALHEAFERAFLGHWGHVPQPAEEWLRQLEVSGGDRSYIFVAERGGRLIGETTGVAKRFGMGWIGTLGVVPEARGLGVGRALILRSLAEFWARGERRVGLGVDAANETGAVRLYESVGMRTTFGAITYEKDVP